MIELLDLLAKGESGEGSPALGYVLIALFLMFLWGSFFKKKDD